MAIQSAGIVDSATAISPTGGTALTFNSLGLEGSVNRAHFTQDTSLVARRLTEFSVKESRPNAASLGGNTQARRKVKITVPKSYTVNGVTYVAPITVTMELAADQNTTVADINNVRYIAAQVLGDSDFDGFWNFLNLS